MIDGGEDWALLRAYFGTNMLKLWRSAVEPDFPVRVWLTFHQVLALGNVRKGERGTIHKSICFMPRVDKTVDDGP
jgi:antirestriction protein ArdC